MDEMNRRTAFQLAGGFALGAAPAAADDKADKADRERVLAAGLTEAEADCWELVAKAAGAFLALPKLHPMDAPEVATAIHVVQHKLLARPTYRKYLELAKGGKK
jgi:hypothetical protein